MDQAFTGLLSNLGVFAPAAALGWYMIRTQRQDIIAQRDQARCDADLARKRVDELTGQVMALASRVEGTMAKFAEAIRTGGKEAADGR